MATVAMLPNRMRIVFPFNDHDPPHFHVVAPDGDMTVRIADLVPDRGRLPARQAQVVVEWARRHHAELG